MEAERQGECAPLAGRGPAEGIHDELLVTTLALEADGVRSVIVAADLLGFPDDFVAEARAEIERRTGIPAGSVLLCASHTHYGPALKGDEGTEPSADMRAYRANLKYVLAGSAQAALSRVEPARVGFGVGESHIGINRRERRPDGRIVLGQSPEGPCDREVRLVRLDTAAGKPLAALVNVACHPVSAAGQMRLLSADYIATMRQVVESFTGATCLFLQGAAGDINPVEMRHSLEPARRLGVMLGGEAAKIFEATATAPAEGLAVRSARLDLPALTYPSVEEGERSVADLGAQMARLKAESAKEGSLWWAQHRLQQAESRLGSLRSGVTLPPVVAELGALRFGDVALVTAPGEIFTQTGIEIKQRSPLARACFVGYANGSIGYVPVPSAYEEGGYEVTHACRVGPEAAERIRDTALELLREIA